MGSNASKDPNRSVSSHSSSVYVGVKDMQQSAVTPKKVSKPDIEIRHVLPAPEERIEERLEQWRVKYQHDITHMTQECGLDIDELEETVRDLVQCAPVIQKYSINVTSAPNVVLQLHLSVSNTAEYNTLVSMFQYLYVLVYLDSNEHLRLLFPDIQQEFCVVDLAAYTEELLHSSCSCIQLYFIDEQGGDQHVITKNILLDYSGELADALSFQSSETPVGATVGGPSTAKAKKPTSLAPVQTSSPVQSQSQDKNALEKSMLVIKNILAVRDPTPHFVYYEMGRILMKLNRFSESETYFRNEIQKGCADSKIFAYNSMGTLLKKMQQVPQAISYLTRAIQLRPNYFEALLTLSTILCVEPMHGYLDWKHLLARAFSLRPNDPLFLHLFVSLKSMHERNQNDSDSNNNEEPTPTPQHEFSIEDIIQMARETNLAEPFNLRTQADFPTAKQSADTTNDDSSSKAPKEEISAVKSAVPKMASTSSMLSSSSSTGQLLRTLSTGNINTATFIVTNLPQNLQNLSVNEIEIPLDTFTQSANQNLLAISNLPLGSNLIIRFVFEDKLSISTSIVLHKNDATDKREFFYAYHADSQQIQHSSARLSDIPQENVVQYPSQDFDSLMNDPLIRDIISTSGAGDDSTQATGKRLSTGASTTDFAKVRAALVKAFAVLEQSVSNQSAINAYADALEALSISDWLDEDSASKVLALLMEHMRALPFMKSVEAFQPHFEILKESLPSAQRRELMLFLHMEANVERSQFVP